VHVPLRRRHPLTGQRCRPQTPAGWDFGKTQTDFVTLLSPGVLNGTHRWLVRARLCACPLPLLLSGGAMDEAATHARVHIA
jgi:hypothetical protein